jgi:hypothetical protein
VSDLFKDHKPELSEEEDRLLWQRVRAIPGPASRPAPWWRRLFAMPAVRYGAPAFAVLLAAVVWVIERSPDFERCREPERAPVVAPAPRDEPTPSMQSPSTEMHEMTQPQKGAAKREVARIDEEASGGAPAPRAKDVGETAQLDAANEAERRSELATPPPAAPPPAASQPAAPAPQTAALKKSAPAFATPPPAAETKERNQAEPQAVSRKVATQSVDQKLASPVWGTVKSNYRDSGGAADAFTMIDSVSALALVVEAAGPGALTGSVPLPDDPPWRAVIALVPGAPPQARLENGAHFGLVSTLGSYARYEDAPPRLQAAALALAFERALAEPNAARAQVERLLVRTRELAARAGKSTGAAKLAIRIERALGNWPAD